jgi:multidrug efflux pump subunit AcrB
MEETPHGWTSKIVRTFLTSKLSVLFIIASFLAGTVALIATPREEEPQIVVPMADLLVEWPGASSQEIEHLVTTPVESLLWEIDGVENVYSISRPGRSLSTVRFYVGEDRERSMVKVYNKLSANTDRLPPDARGIVLKPREMDDIPFLTLALHSNALDDHQLRRIAEELAVRLREVPQSGPVSVIGGRARQVQININPVALAAHGLALSDLFRALQGANLSLPLGDLTKEGHQFLLEGGSTLRSAADVSATVIRAEKDKAVRVGDIAEVVDGPQEVTHYTRIGFGPGEGKEQADAQPAVMVAIAKQKGSNAVSVAEALLHKADALKGTVIPEDVQVTVARNNGETANEKVNDLVKHLLLAIATILVLIALALGPREALIVALAVPMTLAITLLADYALGYTINRVTLFALILSLGLLVDDPIVDVENIHRHFKLKRLPPLQATLAAVEEVRPPTILATFTVILSFLSMYFITGMMGPYMRPMPFNITVVMLMSLVVAFTVTPWATYHLLKGEYGKKETAPPPLEESRTYRLYRRIMIPLLHRKKWRRLFWAALIAMFALSFLLAGLRWVPMKMLPFDNKNELQLLIDLPEGSPLEETDRAAAAFTDYLRTVSEVENVQIYVGTASPVDFNGFVRHYDLRQQANQADLRINLLPKERRVDQSHAIALRLRPDLEKIAQERQARIKIVEVPPGPPVLAGVVAEVTVPVDATLAEQISVVEEVRQAFTETAGVVDVDDGIEADQGKIHFDVDAEKAALHRISVEEIARTLQAAIGGAPAGIVHRPAERNPLPIVIRLPREGRVRPEDFRGIFMRNPNGRNIPLAELVSVRTAVEDKTIYHKDLKRVHFVTGEMAGRSPVEAIIDLTRRFKERPLPQGYALTFTGEGEWQITVDVFRDLGIAFFAALAAIYILLVAWTGSMVIPLVMMAAIPLTMIGIMPGFYLLNLLFANTVGPYENPIFFTATAMIGMIALAGIVIRNSIILIDFIQMAELEGRSPDEAIVEAGAVRLRPILLTAGAAMLGSWVITLDPIFSGLAWSFIFGIFASTLFTLVVIPLLYFTIYGGKGKEIVQEKEAAPPESGEPKMRAFRDIAEEVRR